MYRKNSVIRVCGAALAVLFVTGCAGGSAGGDRAVIEAAVQMRACGLTPPPAAADVNAELKVAKSEGRYWDIFNDEPSGALAYSGTTGFVAQPMRATARAPACALAGAVRLKRPSREADREFNTGCCPPGLGFRGRTDTTITGVPKEGGRFTGTVLLCGQCVKAPHRGWFPVAAEIEWVIKGRRPRRID